MAADYVVKVGGSLISSGKAKRVIKEVVSDVEGDAVFVPGGNGMADQVRAFDDEYSLSRETAHWCAVRCMDINADMLANVSQDVETLEYPFQKNQIRGKQIAKSYDFLKSTDHKHSWKVTSDSIAALVALEVSCSNLVIVTDVEGVYNDGELLTSIDKECSERYKDSCVDEHFPNVLQNTDITCHVVSGEKPRRVAEVCSGNKTKGTVIK